MIFPQHLLGIKFQINVYRTQKIMLNCKVSFAQIAQVQKCRERED